MCICMREVKCLIVCALIEAAFYYQIFSSQQFIGPAGEVEAFGRRIPYICLWYSQQSTISKRCMWGGQLFMALFFFFFFCHVTFLFPVYKPSVLHDLPSFSYCSFVCEMNLTAIVTGSRGLCAFYSVKPFSPFRIL